MLPVRCYTCGKIIGHYEDALNRLSTVLSMEQVFAQLAIRKICCRMHMLCAFDKQQIILDYERSNELFKQRDTSHRYVTVYTEQNTPDRKPRTVKSD